MDLYQIWVDLKETHKDLEFCENVERYLGTLREKGLIQGFRITRRKFGFGPPTIPEFNITIEVKNLAQLDEAFGLVATRANPIEDIHRAVYSMVDNFQSALYRDFPDPQRVRAKGASANR